MSRQILPVKSRVRFGARAKLSRKSLTELVDVGVEDLRPEEDLRGHHGVLVGEEELCVEEAALVGGLAGAGDLHEEVARVSLAGLCVNADDYRHKVRLPSVSRLVRKAWFSQALLFRDFPRAYLGLLRGFGSPIGNGVRNSLEKDDYGLFLYIPSEFWAELPF